MLGKLIGILGQQYSRLTARTYTFVFLFADCVALVVQAIGGGDASSSDIKKVNLGSHIALAGIIFQFCFLIVFIALSIEFVVRLVLNLPFDRKRAATSTISYEMEDRTNSGTTTTYRQVYLQMKTKLLLAGMAFSLTCLFIRAVYRICELSGGWLGHINSTEAFFNFFDGMMVLFGMLTLNVLHPGFLLYIDK